MNGPCESGMSPDCTGRAVHLHHRKLRSQGGTADPSSTMKVCAFCHGAIHASPAKSYAMGQLVKSWQDPAKVSIVTIGMS